MRERLAIFLSFFAFWFCLFPSTKGNCEYDSAPEDSDIDDSFTHDDYPVALYPITDGEKYGYIDRSGKIVVKPQYDEARKFFEGMGAVCIGDVGRDETPHWGYVDLNGNLAIPLQFERAEAFHDGLAVVLSDKGWGYINKTGQYVIRPGLYATVSRFSDGMTEVEEADSSTGYGRGIYDCIDTTGKRLFQFEGVHGIFDQFGGYILSSDSLWFGDLSEGLASFTEGPGNGVFSKYGFMDKCGDVIVEPKYDDVSSFNEGMAAVGIGDLNDWHAKPHGQKWGYIDTTGKVVIDLKFTLAWDFNEGLAPVCVGGKWGYGAGDRVYGGKWGFIDRTGKFVIKPQYELVREFDHGLAKILYEYKYTDHDVSRWAYIDTKGEVVWSGKGDFYNAYYPSTWGPPGWM